MENKDQFINEWYEEVKDSITLSNSYLLLIDLIRQMRAEGLEEDDLEEVGPLLLDKINIESYFESLQTTSMTHLGYRIKKAFDIVFRDIKEIIEEIEDDGIDITGVKKNTTNDTIPSSEAEIDISGVEYAKTYSDEELADYLSGLKLEKYE